MELEKNSKFKIYLVITIFIMIILISAYVVISKIINHETIMYYDTTNNEQRVNDSILEYSNEYIELSLYNKEVYEIYNLISNNSIEEKLYLTKNSEFDWSKTSSVVLSSLDQDLIIYENGKKYVDSDIFDFKYKELFGNYKIGLEKYSDVCDSVSFDITTNRYLLNESCSDDNVEMKTFFKNITYNKMSEEISINKYYVFVKETERINFYTEYEGVDLYLEKDLKKVVVEDIKLSDINNYLHEMNSISYVFKKNINGNYYLIAIK